MLSGYCFRARSQITRSTESRTPQWRPRGSPTQKAIEVTSMNADPQNNSRQNLLFLATLLVRVSLTAGAELSIDIGLDPGLLLMTESISGLTLCASAAPRVYRDRPQVEPRYITKIAWLPPATAVSDYMRLLGERRVLCADHEAA